LWGNPTGVPSQAPIESKPAPVAEFPQCNLEMESIIAEIRRRFGPVRGDEHRGNYLILFVICHSSGSCARAAHDYPYEWAFILNIECWQSYWAESVFIYELSRFILPELEGVKYIGTVSHHSVDKIGRVQPFLPELIVELNKDVYGFRAFTGLDLISAAADHGPDFVKQWAYVTSNISLIYATNFGKEPHVFDFVSNYIICKMEVYRKFVEFFEVCKGIYTQAPNFEADCVYHGPPRKAFLEKYNRKNLPCTGFIAERFLPLFMLLHKEYTVGFL
jgi:hypothetical protein